MYRLLAAALPDDPAAPRYLAMLDQSLGLTGDPPEQVRAMIVGAADRGRQSPRPPGRTGNCPRETLVHQSPEHAVPTPSEDPALDPLGQVLQPAAAVWLFARPVSPLPGLAER